MVPVQPTPPLSRKARDLMRLLVVDGMRQYEASGRDLAAVKALAFVDSKKDFEAVPDLIKELEQASIVDGDETCYVFTERGVRQALRELQEYQMRVEAEGSRLNPYGPEDDEFPWEVANQDRRAWNIGSDFLDRGNRMKDAKIAELVTSRMAAILDDPEGKGSAQRGGRHGLRKLDFQGTKFRLGWCVNTDGSVIFVFLLHREDDEYNSDSSDIESPCC